MTEGHRCILEGEQMGYGKRIRGALSVMAVLILVLCSATALAATNTFAIERQVSTLFEGEDLQLTLKIAGTPESGTVTWTSSNTKVATVTEDGLVTGLTKGRSTITATCRTDRQTFRSTLDVTVQRAVTSVSLNETRLKVLSRDDEELDGLLQLEENEESEENEAGMPVLVLTAGDQVSLTSIVEPESATNRKVILTSSDESVLRVYNMTVTPKQAGECVLTVSSYLNPEVTKDYHVFVVQKVKSIKVTAPARSVAAGMQMRLSAAIAPDTATFQSVTWSSRNEKVATVSADGVVTGLARGQAEIRATATDGTNRYGSVLVTVTQMATAIELNEYATTVAVGYHKTLRATVLPTNANDKSVVWSSSDERICKVNSQGYLTPVKAGECTVTCRSKLDDMVQASCQVTVTQPVTRITFGQKNYSVLVDGRVSLDWSVEPSDVTNPDLTFTSSNTSIATVDENGVVTGHKRGDVYINAKAKDGSNRTNRTSVTVIQPVLGVHMRSDTVRVGVDESVTLSAVLEPENANNRNMTWSIDDEYYAVIRGTNTKPTVRGVHWGTTTAHGVTEDGGYEVDCTINVGNYDKALKIVDLYLQNNAVKITVTNQSNMNVVRFYGIITCYDIYNQPLPCTTTGVNSFECSYWDTLYEGDSTKHGRFNFTGYQQPVEQIGRVTMCLTDYTTDTGYSRNIKAENQVYVEFTAANYIGHLPETPVPETENPPSAQE